MSVEIDCIPRLANLRGTLPGPDGPNRQFAESSMAARCSSRRAIIDLWMS
jgi:hypothetical protein